MVGVSTHPVHPVIPNTVHKRAFCVSTLQKTAIKKNPFQNPLQPAHQPATQCHTDPARTSMESLPSVSQHSISLAASTARLSQSVAVRNSAACKEGLDKLVEGMSAVCESLGVSVLPYGRGGGGAGFDTVHTTSSSVSLPHRRSSSAEDDTAAVLTWMRSTIDGFLVPEELASPGCDASMVSLPTQYGGGGGGGVHSLGASHSSLSLPVADGNSGVGGASANPNVANQQELMIQEVLRRLQSGQALPSQ